MHRCRKHDGRPPSRLRHFITNVRALAIDPVIVRQSWLEAYQYTTDQGAAMLNEFARSSDPFARIGQVSVAVEITSVVRASDSSFQIRWIERSYNHGSLVATERWTAIVSLVIQPPRSEERLRKNPLGIYVHTFNWSQDVRAGDPK